MTISVCPAIYNFDCIPLEAASRILYEEVVPICEANGVHLSYYGNHASREIIVSVEEYDRDKQEHKLFDVERIQRAFKCLDQVIAQAPVIAKDSYGLKYILEKHQGESITNGDCIAAMLINGYTANFVPRFPTYNAQLRVNCQFYIESHL